MKTILSIFNKNNAIWILAIVAGFFYLQYANSQKDLKIQKENARQARAWMQDSIQMVNQVLNQRELNHYLETSNKELGQRLKEDGIKIRRLQQIIQTQLNYKDTTTKVIQVPISDAIKQGVKVSQTFKDETNCLLIEGVVEFDGENINIAITNREFKSKTEIVSFWERNKWSVLGLFKTRIFGKKLQTVKVYDSCGNSKTIVIDKKGNKVR